jgi:hypothetical protein
MRTWKITYSHWDKDPVKNKMMCRHSNRTGSIRLLMAMDQAGREYWTVGHCKM